MAHSVPRDPSNGYERIAAHFLRARNPRIGPATVLEWSATLRARCSILELGCGHGVVSQVLIEAGFALYGVDASPTLAAAFRERFPGVPVECAAAEDSAFFGRIFDAAIAWGLLFLLAPETQARVISKIAGALDAGGSFLFTAPREPVTWQDSLTGCDSVSLGYAAYERILRDAGLTLLAEQTDKGENYYYLASRALHRQIPPGWQPPK